MKSYNLTMDEVQLIVLGSLYNGLVKDDDLVITTLDVKNYLRDVRKVFIKQAEVSNALNAFYEWWKEEEFVLEVGDTAYDLDRKSNGLYYSYYLTEVDTQDGTDNTSVSTIKDIVSNNMDKTSYEIQCIIRNLNILNVPSVRSIAAYKANITRRS